MTLVTNVDNRRILEIDIVRKTMDYLIARLIGVVYEDGYADNPIHTEELTGERPLQLRAVE